MQIESEIFLKDIIQDLVDTVNADNSTNIPLYVGTPIEANFEHQNDKEERVLLKYPFIALFINGNDGQITETFDRSSAYMGVGSVWMVIMNDGNFEDNTVDNAFDNAIQPTLEIYNNLKRVIEKRIDNTIGRPTNVVRKDHTKWGLVAKFIGKTSNVFADKLSGIELNFDLPIIRQYESC